MKKHLVLMALWPVAGVGFMALPASAEPETAEGMTALQPVEVTADKENDVTEGNNAYTSSSLNTATKFNLTPRETPQSVSVVTRTQMDDYNLSTINEVLDTTTGITVERVETDRTYFTSRGFDITNFQLDGVGVPIHWGIADGDVDMAIYDRVEVVRGASGLMSGIGSPAATINLVRKRPTADTQASVKLSAGRWDDYRIDTDVSGSISDTTRTRFVASYQDKDSYLQDYEKNLSVFYGVIDTDLSDDTLLTAGISRQQSRANSPMWGALTLVYSDGTPTDFDVSASTSANWSYWDVQDTRAFVELAHSFNRNWSARVSYNRAELDEDSELLYMYGDLAPVTNEGLTGWASEYDQHATIDQLDAYVDGKFEVAGQHQEIVMGINWAQGDSTESSLYDYSTSYGFPAIGDFTRWTGNTPHPVFTADPANFPDGSDVTDTQKALYFAAHLHFTDWMSAIIGSRVVDYISKGESYGEPEDTRVSGKIIPYGGLVFDLSDDWSLYSSYSETFQPQTDVDINRRRLAPSTGNNLEAGTKLELLGGALNASFAVFKAKHYNVSESAGFDTSNLFTYYEGLDFESRGFETEISGQPVERLNLILGYTNLTVDDTDGKEARQEVPGQSLKLFSSYSLANLTALKFGAGVRWQSDIFIDVVNASGVTRVVQKNLTLVNLFARYAFTPNFTGALNLDNVTNEKYFESIKWEQAYYAAPRNLTASITWTY